jgi:hypothetical protein
MTNNLFEIAIQKNEVDRFFYGESSYFCLNREYGDHSHNMSFSLYVAPFLKKDSANIEFFFNMFNDFIKRKSVHDFDLVLDLVYALSLLAVDNKCLDQERHKHFFYQTAISLQYFFSKFKYLSEYQLIRLELSNQHYSSIGLKDISNALIKAKESFEK